MAQDARPESVVSDWWLPEAGSEDSVPGTYSVLATGNSMIRLHRPIGGEAALFSNSAIPHPLIHGVAFGKPVTLLNSRTKKFQWNFGLQADIELHPHLAIEGLHLFQDELRLTEARVRIQGQDDWITSPRFTRSLNSDGSMKSVTMSTFPQKVSWVQNGCATIWDASSWRGNDSEVSISSKTEFHFLFEEPVLLTEFFDNHLRSLQVLMTMITGERCGVEGLKFTDTTWEIDGSAPSKPHWVTARLRAPDARGRRRVPELLVPFECFNWEAQAPAVFDLSTAWAYSIEQWALLLDSRFVWPVARFATAASAVEALDRILNPPEKPYAPDDELIARVKEELKKTSLNGKDRGKIISGIKRPTETSLDQRIARLTELAPDAMKQLIDRPLWTNRVAKLRHVVSHGLESSEDFSRDTRALECGSEILLHILECAFLCHLGFNANQINEIKMQHPSTWQRKRIVDECFDLLPKMPVQAIDGGSKPESEEPAASATETPSA
ncbi:HEPN domain-containing protein [Streptomyces sp. NPDC002054]|uniref:ApeA N-terminal domain 1-containing protein n=1 Tax=Streptomyces sp. NPDC002054 TaxID=3154663 RepID=UPI00332283B2